MAKASIRRTNAGPKKPGGTPPQEYKYKKGQSGNLRGRPKGSRNLSSIILEAAEKKVKVTIDGVERNITIKQATAMQLAKQAVSGDHRGMAKFLDLVEEYERRAEEGGPAQYTLSDADTEVLRAIYLRMQLCKSDIEEDN